MELQAKFDRRIDEIQRKLRECNYECNRLKELFSDSLAHVRPIVSLPPEAETQVSLLADPQITEQEKTETHVVEGPSVVTPEEVSRDADAGRDIVDVSVNKGPKPLEGIVPSEENVGPVAPEHAGPVAPEHAGPVAKPVAPENTKPLAPGAKPAPPKVAAATPPPIPVRPPAQRAENRRPAQRAENRPPAGRKSAAKAAPSKPRGSMEKFIGENLLNKIGIGILVIGIGIFVKYAIDQDWIGHIGRVLVGVLTGGILMGVAHFLRKKYKAFSSVLVGGGIATLYFSISIAFQTYGLMSQPLAFAIMTIITAFSVIMAIGYDRQEIGIIALLGGFVTPFLVSQGEGSYISLFSYILILNVGAMALAWFKNWKAIRILSYSLTVILFGGWVALNMTYFDTPVVGGTIAFASAFFVVFFAMNVAFSVRNKMQLKSLDFILLLSNSAFFYAVTMLTLFWFDEGRYMGIFSALMGVFHFAFIFPAKKWIAFDDRLVKVLVGLVLTFVTAAVGIQLEGSHLTIFWAVEAVILLILARKTKMDLLENATILLSVLTIGSLFRDWGMNYLAHLGSDNSPVLNGDFLTTLFAVGSFFAISFLNYRMRRENKENGYLSDMYRFLGIGLLYIGSLLETLDHLVPLNNSGLTVIGISTLTVYFLIGLHVWARIAKNHEFGNFAFTLSILFFIATCAAQIMFMAPMRLAYLNGLPEGDGFMNHFLMAPGLFVLLGLSFVHGKRIFDKNPDGNNLLLWGLSIILVFIFSMELDTLLALGGVSAAHAHKIGYPILWGVLGFAMIATGLRSRLRHLRIAGLALFLLIIVKLFVYDIRSIPTGGKIAAFISLGVLLLVVSFLYQRIKRLVVEDDPQAALENAA